MHAHTGHGSAGQRTSAWLLASRSVVPLLNEILIAYELEVARLARFGACLPPDGPTGQVFSLARRLL